MVAPTSLVNCAESLPDFAVRTPHRWLPNYRPANAARLHYDRRRPTARRPRPLAGSRSSELIRSCGITCAYDYDDTQLPPSSTPTACPSRRCARCTARSALLVAAACLGVLVTAALLTPSPTGVGTHTAMHYQPCDFLAHTGVPCPQLRHDDQLRVVRPRQPARQLLRSTDGHGPRAADGGGVLGLCFISDSPRGPTLNLLGPVPGRYYLFPLFALAVAGWAWKMFTIARGIDGWPVVRKIRMSNIEIRNKSERRRSNDRNEDAACRARAFRSFPLLCSTLFRISTFGFRVSAAALSLCLLACFSAAAAARSSAPWRPRRCRTTCRRSTSGCRTRR